MKSKQKEDSVFSQNKTDLNLKNSKVLVRKQIEKKTQGLKEDQYIKIVNNLTNQSNRLKTEVKDLSDKVQQLLISKKINKNQKNPQIQQQIMKLKGQLELKYESMNYLKDELKKHAKNELSNDSLIHTKQQENALALVQKEILRLDKEKKKLLQCILINEEDVRDYEEPTNAEIQQKIQSLKIQNKELKNQIFEKNQILKIGQKDSIETINKLYDLKKSQEKYMKSVFESRNIKKTNLSSQPTLQELKLSSISQFNVLQKEVEQLRRKKREAEKELMNDRMVKEAKKVKLEKDIRESLEFHKDLFKRRVKAFNQLNLLEKRDQQYKQTLEMIANKQKIQYLQSGSQTQLVVEKELRKDWIGVVTGTTFDDSMHMDSTINNYIRAVTIFKNSEHIVFIKFLYQNAKRKYETETPFDASILKKCQIKKLSARSNGHLVNMIINLTDKKINKVDFKWSDGETSGFGNDQINSTKFILDLMDNERPVSIFGSFISTAKNTYALESLGCSITSD